MAEKEIADQLHQQIHRGWLWCGVEQFVQRGLALLVSVVLARLLSPEVFGLIASVSVFLLISQQLIDGGISARIIQKKEVHEDDFTALFWCNVIMSVAVCGSLVLLSHPIARFYNDPRLVSVVIVMALAIFLMKAGRVQHCRLTREMQFKKISLIMMISCVAGSIVGLGIAFAGGGVWAILGQQFIIYFVRAILYWSTDRWHPRGVPCWHAVKDIYSFGAPILISQTVRGFSEQMINVLGARFVGLTDLGFFDRGRFIPSSAEQVGLAVFTRTNLTALSRANKSDREFSDTYFKLNRMIIPLFCMGTTGIGICAPEIIETILGVRWLPSVWFLRAGCVMSALRVFFIFSQDILKAKGAIKALFKQNIIYAALQVIGVILGLRWGFRGMILGAIAACSISCFLQTVVISRHSPIVMRDQVTLLLGPLVKSLVVAGGLLVVKQIDATVWVRFSLCMVTCAGIMGLLYRVSFFSLSPRS